MPETPHAKAFRRKHLPKKPPFLGVMLREEDAHALANGVVTATVQVMAAEAIEVFWPTAAAKVKA